MPSSDPVDSAAREQVVGALAQALHTVERRAVAGIPEGDTLAAAEELFRAIEPLVEVRNAR